MEAIRETNGMACCIKSWECEGGNQEEPSADKQDSASLKHYEWPTDTAAHKGLYLFLPRFTNSDKQYSFTLVSQANKAPHFIYARLLLNSRL